MTLEIFHGILPKDLASRSWDAAACAPGGSAFAVADGVSGAGQLSGIFAQMLADLFVSDPRLFLQEINAAPYANPQPGPGQPPVVQDPPSDTWEAGAEPSPESPADLAPDSPPAATHPPGPPPAVLEDAPAPVAPSPVTQPCLLGRWNRMVRRLRPNYSANNLKVQFDLIAGKSACTFAGLYICDDEPPALGSLILRGIVVGDCAVIFRQGGLWSGISNSGTTAALSPGSDWPPEGAPNQIRIARDPLRIAPSRKSTPVELIIAPGDIVLLASDALAKCIHSLYSSNRGAAALLARLTRASCQTDFEEWIAVAQAGKILGHDDYSLVRITFPAPDSTPADSTPNEDNMSRQKPKQTPQAKHLASTQKHPPQPVKPPPPLSASPSALPLPVAPPPPSDPTDDGWRKIRHRIELDPFGKLALVLVLAIMITVGVLHILIAWKQLE